MARTRVQETVPGHVDVSKMSGNSTLDRVGFLGNYSASQLRSTDEEWNPCAYIPRLVGLLQLQSSSNRMMSYHVATEEIVSRQGGSGLLLQPFEDES